MNEEKRAYENGKRAAQLESIQEGLDDIKATLADISRKLNASGVAMAGVRLQLKVLWAAAGVYGVTLLGLALKAVWG